MAKTAAERTREFRERQRLAENAAILSAPPGGNYLSSPFSDFLHDRNIDVVTNLDAFGVTINGTELTEEVQEFDSYYAREEPMSALQRATGLVDVFLDSAKELAHLINVYKLEEINRAIDAALTASANLPRGDVDHLKESFIEIDRLRAIQTQLRRPSRHMLLATRAKGE